LLRKIPTNLALLKYIGEWYSFEIYQFNDSEVLYMYKEFVEMDNRHFVVERKILDFLHGKFNVLSINELIKIDNRIGFCVPLKTPKIMAIAIREEPDNLEKYARILGKTHSNLHCSKHKIELIRHDEYINKRLNNIQYLKRHKQDLIDLYKTCHEEEVLCHNDFGAFHLLLEDNEPFVIDWVNASYAPPIADVSKCIFWTCSNYVPGIGTYLINKDEKVRFVEYYIDEYSKTGLIDYEKLKKWLVIYSAIEYDNEISEEPECPDLEKYKCFVIDYFEGKEIDIFDYIINDV